MHLSGNGANCVTDVAHVVVPVRIARIEVQVVGVVRVRRILRRRPVVAVRAGVVEVVIPAVARRRQERHPLSGSLLILMRERIPLVRGSHPACYEFSSPFPIWQGRLPIEFTNSVLLVCILVCFLKPLPGSH